MEHARVGGKLVAQSSARVDPTSVSPQMPSCVDKVELGKVLLFEALSPKVMTENEGEVGLRLHTDELQVTITCMNGKSSTLTLGVSDTVKDLKVAIYNTFGIRPRQQKLILGEESLTDNNATMSSLAIQVGSEIVLDVAMVAQTFDWKPGDDFVVLETFESILGTTPFCLKKGTTGCWYATGDLISDMSRVMTDCPMLMLRIPEQHINKLDFVEDCGDGFKVVMQTLTGKALLLRGLQSHNTIFDLKSKVLETDGIPPDGQRMVFAGKELEDGRTLAEYKIQGMSTVHLILRLRGGMLKATDS